MKAEDTRTCPSCGNEFSGAMEFCPVCLLRECLTGGVESGESSSGDTLKPLPDQPAQRFEHYELVTDEDGKPVELGGGGSLDVTGTIAMPLPAGSGSAFRQEKALSRVPIDG